MLAAIHSKWGNGVCPFWAEDSLTGREALVFAVQFVCEHVCIFLSISTITIFKIRRLALECLALDIERPLMRLL